MKTYFYLFSFVTLLSWIASSDALCAAPIFKYRCGSEIDFSTATDERAGLVKKYEPYKDSNSYSAIPYIFDQQAIVATNQDRSCAMEISVARADLIVLNNHSEYSRPTEESTIASRRLAAARFEKELRKCEAVTDDAAPFSLEAHQHSLETYREYLVKRGFREAADRVLSVRVDGSDLPLCDSLVSAASSVVILSLSGKIYVVDVIVGKPFVGQIE